MYTLYTDKMEKFQCSIDVEGASLSETEVRLVLESDKLNLLYEGSIDASGNCTIPVDKLKNILKEGTEGVMRLEVIAEDTFFSPWEDEFEVKTNKRVTVEVLGDNKQQLKENKVRVKVAPKRNPPPAQTPPPEPVTENKVSPHTKNILRLLEIKGINHKNITENLDYTTNLISKYMTKFDLEGSDDMLTEILTEIIK